MKSSFEDLIFCTSLDKFNYNQKIIDIIDASSDVQNHATNVKAKMTRMDMMDCQGFNELGINIIDFCRIVSKRRHDCLPEMYIYSMWGMCYQGNDYAVAHNHWPATWACAYYVDVPPDAPPICFPDLNLEVQVKKNKLVLFPGWLSHKVVGKPFDGKRYVVSANIHVK